MKKSLGLHWQILIAMLLAIVATFVLRQFGSAPPSEGGAKAIEAWLLDQPLGSLTRATDLVGGLFLKLLKMIIMPLIFASVVMSIADMQGLKRLKRLGLRTLAFYAVTTLLAVLVGIVLVNLMQPGVGMGLSAAVAPDKEPATVEALLLSMVPDNVFDALTNNSSILSVIVFAILFGVALVTLGEKAAAVRDFVRGLYETMMLLTDWIIQLAPIGVFALLVSVLARTGMAIIAPLSSYMMTVILGLLFHAAVTLPLFYWVVTRRSPYQYFRALSTPLLTAFSTASSSATLPLTLEHTEKRGGVSPTVAGFVLPLGATVNMDGTALYEAVAAIFIAQAYGIDLTLGQQVIIVLTATLAAIGAAGIPSAGLVTMLIVLESVGLPKEGYGLIVAVDRLLDMCRTTVNVWGDTVGAAVLAKGEGELGEVDLDAL